jgi:release factor glutamine methyltransferase
VKTIEDTLPLASSFLGHRRDAEEIFAHVLGMKRIELYMHYDRPLLEQELEQVRVCLKRRVQGEPLEQIFGWVEFYGCSIAITRDVLIPRPETELLVDLMVQKFRHQDLTGKHLWDLCTGSGCIGLALKRALPNLQVTLSDLSPDALQVAQQNATRNALDVELLCGDFLAPFTNRMVDILVCNPPYVSLAEYGQLDRSVRDYEPKQALLAGKAGWEFYERLVRELPPFLKSGSQLFLELGASQGDQVYTLFKHVPARSKEVKKDYAGYDRFFFLEIE